MKYSKEERLDIGGPMEAINGWIKAEIFMDFHITGETSVTDEIDKYFHSVSRLLKETECELVVLTECEYKYIVFFHGSRADSSPETHGAASLAFAYTNDFSAYFF